MEKFNMAIRQRRAQSGKPKPFFRAALQGDTLELTVYQDIGDTFGDGGGVTVKAFKEQIDQAGNFQRILLRINSPGGDPFEGTAIHSLIRAQKKPVEVCIDGIAASAASIIAMAGDTITMAPGAMMMIHNASGFCQGFAEDMYATGDALKAVSVSIAQTYASRTKKPLEEITAMMDAETWMTAEECLDQGFCTNIVEEPEIGPTALALAKQFRALGRMKHLPKALQNDGDLDDAAECACDCPNCLDGNCDRCDNPECDDPNCEDCPMQAEAQASVDEFRDRLGIGPVSIENARARLEEIDSHSADAVTIDDARGELDAIEGVLYTPENEAPTPELQRRYVSALGRRG
jgi:ATP-dependent Clp protease protease subunit